MQEFKQLLGKVHLNQLSVLITSVVIIAANITAFPVKAQTQADMDKLRVQLERTVSTRNWKKSISVVDKMLIMIPSTDHEQRIRLKNYRAELRLLYDSKIEPHFYPPIVVQNFIKGCSAKGGEQMKPWCTCFIDKLEDKYTLEQFVQLDLKLKNSGGTQMSDDAVRGFREIGASCRLASK